MIEKQWERKELDIEFNDLPKDRCPFFLGSISLARKFEQRPFITSEAKSLLMEINKKGIPVYPFNLSLGWGETNCTWLYYQRGVLEKNPEKYKTETGLVNQYRVIIDRIPIIERELRKTKFGTYLYKL